MRARRRWALLAPLLCVTGPAPDARADDRAPHAGYVFPAGGCQGTTFQVVVAGQYLNNPTEVYVSGAGVRAKVVGEERPLTANEQQMLRDTLQALQAKRQQGKALTAEELRTVSEIRSKLLRLGRRPDNPAISELITLDVTVDATAPIGRREVRLGTQAGLTNPLVFDVGDLPEVSEAAWQHVREGRGGEPDRDVKVTETRVTLPVTVNGQIPPGGMDRYRFAARAGQQLVVAVQARALIPYIADAVPGWFQATATLYDAKGHELAYSDDYRFHPDPVVFYRIPAAGDYVLEVKDALFRGREDFVYRISAGELPFVTGIFPLGGRVGTQSTLLASGWNLPFRAVELDLRDATPGVRTLPDERVANAVVYAADTLPETAEAEPNDTREQAQAVARPIIVNGRIDAPGDLDVYRFNAMAGDAIVLEVEARRLDSPVDSLLIVTDAYGKQVAVNDDHEDKGSGLNTHHADSYLSFTVKTGGACTVQLGDTQGGGGPAYGYRLRISGPQPDFALRVTPSTLNVRAGGSVPLTVHALRRDGFDGEIEVAIAGAPKGFTLAGDPIAKGQALGRYTLNAPPSVPADVFDLRVEGRAKVRGKSVTHEAVPADDMMQAFAYRHLVPAQRLEVAIVGRLRAPGAAQILTATPIRIPAGGAATVEVSLPAVPASAKVELTLDAPPDGISIKAVNPLAATTEIVLQADPAKVKVGSKGNLIVEVSAERPGAAAPNAAAKRRVPLGTLPAIPYEIVRK